MPRTALRFVFDLRPGDVLAHDFDQDGDIPFHNGDPHVTRVQHDYTADGVTYAVCFADGSITETTNARTAVRVER